MCYLCQNVTCKGIVIFQIEANRDSLDVDPTWRLFQDGVQLARVSRNVTKYCANLMKFVEKTGFTIPIRGKKEQTYFVYYCRHVKMAAIFHKLKHYYGIISAILF